MNDQNKHKFVQVISNFVCCVDACVNKSRLLSPHVRVYKYFGVKIVSLQNSVIPFVLDLLKDDDQEIVRLATVCDSRVCCGYRYA
jgi:hypothetical protein